MRLAHQRCPRLRLLLPVVALLASGVAPTVRDSAGVTIVENPAGAVEAAPTWRVGPEPLVEIGAVEGPPERLFSRVTGAALLSDGRVAVAQDDPPEIRFFAPDGSHLRTVGGEGEGPGEFLGLGGLVRLSGDTLAAFDPRSSRVSRLAPDGSFLGSTRLEAGLPRELVGRSADGRWLLEPVEGYRRAGAPREGAVSPSVPLLAYDTAGSPPDTLLVRPGPTWHLSRSGPGWWPMRTLFPVGPHTAVGPEALYTGHGRSWEIQVRGADGRVRRLVRLDRERPPVTGSAVDSAVRRRAAGIDTERERQHVAEVLRAANLPERRPAFRDLRLDRAGRVWVQETAAGPDGTQRWIVFGPGGRVRAVALLPAGLAVLAIGRDRIAGRWTDELDVQHVRVYRLERDAPDSPE